MAGYKNLTITEARRIWMLHEKGLKTDDIMFAVDRHRNSVLRVVEIFAMAAAGDWEGAERHGAKNQNIVSYARELFGAPAAKPAPQPAAPAAPDNTAKFLESVLTELQRNNELLEKLLAAWEGQA